MTDEPVTSTVRPACASRALRTFTKRIRCSGHGPCPQHRMRFVNVARARDAQAARALQLTGPGAMVDDVGMSRRSDQELSATP